MIDETVIEPALGEIRSLVQADGGDMELVAVDPGGAVELRLVLEGAECAECVMPREFLEQIALDMMRRSSPEVTRVAIEDPREDPDFDPGGA